MIKGFNVWVHNINKRTMETLNVFEHGGFYKYCMKAYKEFDKDKDYKKFSEQLKKEAKHYFWCKAEYEITIIPWVGRNKEERKIDVYDQLEMNWDLFMVAAICELGTNEKNYNDKGECIYD